MANQDLDLSNLRPLLDAEEKYARSIPAGDPRAPIAQQMLTVIADARSRLQPSAEPVYNYVPHKQIIEQLSDLRAQAERLARSGAA